MLENLNPFKWGSSEAKESAPAPTSPEGKIDISIPTFHFTKEEIADFTSKGMTEDEIELKEKEIINRLARARSGGMTN